MIGEIFIFIITTILTYSVYSYKKNHNLFKRNDVKFLPGFPIFGNSYKSTFLRQHIIYDINDVYRAFPEERYVGYFDATEPIVLIRDPDIIKLITVKDFDHFVDHRSVVGDDIFTDALIMMKGERWRDMRATLSPVFTVSKMKQMMPFMSEISQNIIEYLKESQRKDIDVEDLMQRYTNDVIASTAFGLEVNSMTNPNNQFFKLGQEIMSFTFWQRVKMLLIVIFPFLSKVMDIFPKHTKTFFKDIVKNTMEYRDTNNIDRPDMIQLLMEANKGTLKAVQDEINSTGFSTTEEVLKPNRKIRRWNQNELAAQAFNFFFAGFEISASVLVMAIHEIVLHPEAQAKLFEEVSELQKKRGKLTYDDVAALKYLDCVINETLRKWSPALFMDRICLKSYTLPPPRKGGEPYTVKPGDIIYNVVNSLHMDEQFYPDPLKFDPDRFADENKKNIKPFTFIPFGTGPRNCIGSRFAILEIKILLFHLILNFEIIKCEKTADPIILKPQDFNIRATSGTWVRFNPRN